MTTEHVTSDEVKQDRNRAITENRQHDVAAFHMHGFEMALEKALDAARVEHQVNEPFPIEVKFTAVMKPTKNPTQILRYEASVERA